MNLDLIFDDSTTRMTVSLYLLRSAVTPSPLRVSLVCLHEPVPHRKRGDDMHSVCRRDTAPGMAYSSPLAVFIACGEAQQLVPNIYLPYLPLRTCVRYQGT